MECTIKEEFTKKRRELEALRIKIQEMLVN
jgi:hypothetical protein